MITQLSHHVSFDPAYMPAQRVQNEEYYTSNNLPIRTWALGHITDSAAGPINGLTGKTTRTPGEYHPTDPDTGKDLPRRMRKTSEFIHPSVRYRIEQKGKGLEDKGEYNPAALKGWRYISPDEHSDVGGKMWQNEGKWFVKRKDGTNTFIVEDQIVEGTPEWDLMASWAGVVDQVYPPME